MRGRQVGQGRTLPLHGINGNVTVEGSQLAAVEILPFLDIAVQPEEADGEGLEQARLRFAVKNFDRLLLPEPRRRTRSPAERQARLSKLVAGFHGDTRVLGLPDEDQVRDVGMMLSTIGSLFGVHGRIDHARHRAPRGSR